MNDASGPVLLAKSSGVTLADHTQHLRDQLDKHVIPAHGFALQKYERVTGGSLAALTLKSVKWHDSGKKHKQWQDACQKDYRLYLDWKNGGEAGPKPRGVNLMKAKIRHELASLPRMLKTEPDVSPLIRAAVAAHHGKLSYRHLKRWQNDVDGAFYPFWTYFHNLSEEIDFSSESDFPTAVLRRYAYAGPRTWLQLADHRASAFEDGKNLPVFTPFSYTFKYSKSPTGVQEKIKTIWDEPLALLRAPTGAGKTDAALLWAQHQIDSDRADRLVIAMPTRFTANALAIANASNLSSTGLYHSSAWNQEQDADLEMARLMETPVTVTTLDHLCICLTGTREDHHSIFFNLAHSCVVIDEADFYDDFTQANVQILLRVLKLLDVPVLIMSATLPDSACTLYTAPAIHADTSDDERIRCRLHRPAVAVRKPSDIEDLLKPIIEGTPAIIYANTVQRAQRYYRWLSERMPQENVLLYHSRFTEPQKKKIESRLINMLGKDAWKEGTRHGVAILTQIGELSVNISADYMLSELCPLDRLVQRVGRLSRFPQSHGPGDLYLLMPHKKAKDGSVIPYPAPYGSFKNGWVPAPALTRSDSMLVEGEYSAGLFVDLVNKLYPQVSETLTHVRENQRSLKRMIGMNWLILSGGEVSPEDDQVANGVVQWRSRDIDPQQTVLVDVQRPSQFFDGPDYPSRWMWRKTMLEHGISIQNYEFKRALENGCLDECLFAIGDDPRNEGEKAYLVKTGFYDAEMGLNFGDPEDEEDSNDGK